MACRSLILVMLVAACQQLPEAADDDDSGPMMMGSTGTDGGSFLDIATSTAGDTEPGNDEIGEIECDPVAQMGCGSGEKCTAQKVGSTVVYACVADMGTLDPYGSCTPALSTGADGCPAGYACLGSPTGGACVPLCLMDSDCTGGICVPDRYDFVQHCANDCSPFEPSCPSPLQCRRAVTRYSCQFAIDEDVGVDGDLCEMENDAGCATGYACVPGALVPDCTEGNCCTPLCDLSGADPCPSPATCASVFEMAAPGFETIGACFVPA